MRKLKGLSKPSFPAPDVVTEVVPAPTDGWDAISPLAQMDPKRAPILDNWVPRPGWVELRQGFTFWNSDIAAAPVETLMVWRGPSQQKMFAAAGNSIYDVSVSITSTAVVAGLSSARWQYVNFTPAGAATVIQLVNGEDTLRQYNGSAWSVPTITGLPSGVTTADFINIYAQKRRLWYLVNQSTTAIFMPTDAITGAIAGTLDFGALWTKGGYVVAMGDWTIDGGNGPQDYAVFISSRGQVSVYSGDDPTDASNWSLVGTFDLSPPIGRRCFTKVGSDIGAITLQGVLPISQALPFDPSADRSVAITARIQNAMAQACAQAQNNFGWQLISYPAQQLAVLNVPLVENVVQVQFVMDALTGAWCRFTGWNANCFEIYNENLYFGDNNGNVRLAYTGGLDFDQPIVANMQCAYNYFNDPGRTKRMTMVQPLLVASGILTPSISVDEDFGVSTSLAPISIITGGALWDVALWDAALWPDNQTTITDWLSVEAIGHALAVHMQVNVGSGLPGFGIFDVSEFDDGEFDGSGAPAPTLQVNAFNAIMEFGGFI